MFMGNPIPGGTACGIGIDNIILRAVFNPLTGALSFLGSALNLANLPSIEPIILFSPFTLLCNLCKSLGQPSDCIFD